MNKFYHTTESLVSVKHLFFWYGHKTIIFFPYFLIHIFPFMFLCFILLLARKPSYIDSTQLLSKSVKSLPLIWGNWLMLLNWIFLLKNHTLSSFILFGIITIFLWFCRTLLGAVEGKPLPHRIQLPDVYDSYWIAFVCKIIIRMDILFQAQTGINVTFCNLCS